MSTLQKTAKNRALRVALEQHDLHIKDLARESGLHALTVGRIFAGTLLPCLPTAIKLAAILGSTPEGLGIHHTNSQRRRSRVQGPKSGLNRQLRKAIKAKGLTQKELALEVGLAESSISRVINGHLRFCAKTASRIAEFLGATPEAVGLAR